MPVSPAPIDLRSLGRQLHELLILAALKPRPLHGYAVARSVEERSRGRFVLSHGTLYPLLHGLERAAYIRSRWVEAGAQRRRRVYALTHAGASRLRDEVGTLKDVFGVVLEMLQPRA
jgi:PadR family transcriptional regulator, regulatory protein PadR